MVEANAAAKAFFQRSEFESFLFASLGDDGNGMSISVLSVLSRLDIDAWDEAAKLTRLPKDEATLRIASLIEAQRAGGHSHGDDGISPSGSSTIASRLVGLLPSRASAISSHMAVEGGTLSQSSAIAMSVILVLFLLAAGWIVAQRQMPPPADTTGPAIGSTSPSKPL